jgi:protein-tyrosine phosphatase
MSDEISSPLSRLRRTALASLILTIGLAGIGVLESAVAITEATCEPLGGNRYRIEFDNASGVGPVKVYASASPNRFDSNALLTTTSSSPVTVAAPGRAKRVYFHLQPESGPARVVATRQILLEGADNFRDLGGYRTTDGRFVRWGRVYRSDHLTALTRKDYDMVSELGLRLVCDLRTPGERQKAPTSWEGPPPTFLFASILSDRDLGRVNRVPPDEFKRRLAAAAEGIPPPDGAGYARFVTEYVDSYRQLMRRLVANELPAVTHCTAGRDRTGVYAAVLLTMLGVPYKTVEADYLLTDRYRLTPMSIDRQAREWKAAYVLDELPSRDAVRVMRSLRPETLRATFDAITREYGSFDAFRRNTLQVSDADLESLRSNLLEQ